jgi:hypothetical protein
VPGRAAGVEERHRRSGEPRTRGRGHGGLLAHGVLAHGVCVSDPLLMDLAGARNRMQLGWHAATRDWLS